MNKLTQRQLQIWGTIASGFYEEAAALITGDPDNIADVMAAFRAVYKDGYTAALQAVQKAAALDNGGAYPVWLES